MRTRIILCRAIFGSLMLTAPALQAASANTHPCAVVAEDASRLACYDAAFGAPANQQSASHAVGVAVPVAAVPGPSVAVGAETGAANAASMDPVRAFGLESTRSEQKRAEENAARPKEIESVTSLVKSVSTRMLGELVVELENGQVWTQLERDTKVRLRAGEPATISRGALGSYKLVSGSSATKVRRIR